MTFSVSRDMGAFEWAGNNLLTVFCQPKSLLDLEVWRLLYDVLRFNTNAQRFLIELGSKSTKVEEISIGTYLERHGYSDSFRDNYLIVCAIFLHWKPRVMLTNPVRLANDCRYLEHSTRQMLP